MNELIIKYREVVNELLKYGNNSTINDIIDIKESFKWETHVDEGDFGSHRETFEVKKQY